jgi:hypothetical protein
MDFLGFFKGRNDFLEIKYAFPPKSSGHTGSSGSGSAAAPRAAGRPLAPARDPAMGGAAGS